MKLEDEIQQKNFKNAKHRAMLNLLFTASWLQCMQSRFFKEYGLSQQQYNVLRILRGQKGQAISVNGIQERMLDRSSNASRLIDKLKEKKLVERVVSKNDRRQMDIIINKTGLDLLQTIDEEMNDFETSIGKITEKEADELNRLLEKIRNN
jgi:DNA-binding MarR family transcriptional regulator